MSTTFQGLRTLGYKVPDLPAAKKWYTDVLGIEPYFDEHFYVGFNIGGYELGLQPYEGNVVRGNAAVTYWGVQDVKATYEALLAAGATSLEEPADVGGDIVVAAVSDPWGNPFGVIYNPHFKVS